jgi:hypothetical protein
VVTAGSSPGFIGADTRVDDPSTATRARGGSRGTSEADVAEALVAPVRRVGGVTPPSRGADDPPGSAAAAYPLTTSGTARAGFSFDAGWVTSSADADADADADARASAGS